MKIPALIKLTPKAKILIAASCFYKIALGLQLPILYDFVLKLGGNLTHLGIIFAIYGIIYAVTSFLITLYFQDYRHFLFSASFIIWSLYALLMYHAYELFHIYLLQFMAGMSTAFGRPNFVQILVKNTEEEFATTHGFYELLASLFGALAAALSGYIGHHYAVRPLFLAMCGSALIAFVISLFLLKFQDSDREKPGYK